MLSSQIHADNEKLQGEVAGALRNLAGEKSPREGEEGGAPAPAPAEASTAGIKPPVARRGLTTPRGSKSPGNESRRGSSAKKERSSPKRRPSAGNILGGLTRRLSPSRRDSSPKK